MKKTLVTIAASVCLLASGAYAQEGSSTGGPGAGAAGGNGSVDSGGPGAGAAGGNGSMDSGGAGGGATGSSAR